MSNRSRSVVVMLVSCLAVSLDHSSAQSSSQRPNILIIIADDVSARELSCYEQREDSPNTPVICGLKNTGVLFKNAWSNPVCSPTRATILTGQYAFRTRIGGTVTPDSPFALPVTPIAGDGVTLPQRLKELGYNTGAFGKWHLGNRLNEGSEENSSIVAAGFDVFKGTPRNINSFFAWPYVIDSAEDGTATTSTQIELATTVTTRDALAWIKSQPVDQPWFAYVAYNAPHHAGAGTGTCGGWQDPQKTDARPSGVTPREADSYLGKPLGACACSPPDGIPRCQDTPSCNRKCYLGQLEALDQRIGELVTDDRVTRYSTLIFFVGDNGTARSASGFPESPRFDQGKGSVFQGGVHVPFIVSSPNHVTQPGRHSEALVNLSDIFATALWAASRGPASAPAESAPLQPLLLYTSSQVRSYAYTELFEYRRGANEDIPETTGRAVRGPRYKLIEWLRPCTMWFYDNALRCPTAVDPGQCEPELNADVCSPPGRYSLYDLTLNPTEDLTWDLCRSCTGWTVAAQTAFLQLKGYLSSLDCVGERTCPLTPDCEGAGGWDNTSWDILPSVQSCRYPDGTLREPPCQGTDRLVNKVKQCDGNYVFTLECGPSSPRSPICGP